MRDRPTLIDAIEAVIQRDVGRNIAPLFAAARGGLRGAVAALAELADAAGDGAASGIPRAGYARPRPPQSAASLAFRRSVISMCEG